MRRWRVGLLALGLLGAAGGKVRSQVQQTVLQIKPHAGDTLRMRLDQENEMSGVRRTPHGESAAMSMTSMQLFSRAIVERNTDRGTVVLAVTDSVELTTSDAQQRNAARSAVSELRGQKARFQVTPDGTVGTVGTVDANDTNREVSQVVSLMPATFPTGPIRVGESWVREMVLPTGLQLGARLSGKLHVTFQLDSVTHAGDWAFVSMRGDMEPAKGPGASSRTVLEQGMVTGTMLVDKKRGWLADSWFTIVVNSMQSLSPTGDVTMRTQTRITQHMHTFERR